MNILITQWALDSYLDLKHKRAFTEHDFKTKLKPDVRLLKQYPLHPKFSKGKFWSPVTINSTSIRHGFKMKWHQIGSGRIQLRLPVAILGKALLCEGYVKFNNKVEKRKLAKFKVHLQLIQQGRYTIRGVI